MKKTIKRKTKNSVERDLLYYTGEGWKEISSILTGWSFLRGKYYYIILEKKDE
jgi:hypothetical protein